MRISATELKANVDRSLKRAANEDVYVTRNGRVVATISSPVRNKRDFAKSPVPAIKPGELLELVDN
jgi:antitoxin (DNA-binding transcriptional repressor) of toxin-antitoxin stability system